MNNLPLQPLVWDSQNYTQSAFHQYLVRKDSEARKNSKSQYEVAYGRINTQHSFDVATGFSTIDEAKAWAWKHYNEKMQPYVKPTPTWIDASEQLPSVDTDTQFICAYDSAIDTFSRVGWFNADIGKFDYQHDDVLAWMPIPEFSTMQILHKGE